MKPVDIHWRIHSWVNSTSWRLREIPWDKEKQNQDWEGHKSCWSSAEPEYHRAAEFSGCQEHSNTQNCLKDEYWWQALLKFKWARIPCHKKSNLQDYSLLSSTAILFWYSSGLWFEYHLCKACIPHIKRGLNPLIPWDKLSKGVSWALPSDCSFVHCLVWTSASVPVLTWSSVALQMFHQASGLLCPFEALLGFQWSWNLCRLSSEKVLS